MNIIESEHVDLLTPFPQTEVGRVYGWKHCYRTLSEDDDVPQDKETFTESVAALLPISLTAGIIDKQRLTSARHEAPLVGLVAFVPSGFRDGALHFAAGRKAFKMGLVDEALRLFIPHVWESFPQLLRVTCLLDDNNTPAKSTLKRLGFQYEGLTRNAVLVGGVPRARVQLGLVRAVPGEVTAKLEEVIDSGDSGYSTAVIDKESAATDLAR